MKKTMFLMIMMLALLVGVGSADDRMTGDKHGMMQESGQQEKMTTQTQEDEEYMMYPGMMGSYGMGPGMMRGYGSERMYGGTRGCYEWGPGKKRFSSPEQYEKFLDETKELRKKMHDLRFEYGEISRNPDTTVGDLKKMEQQIDDLRQEIWKKAAE